VNEMDWKKWLISIFVVVVLIFNVLFLLRGPKFQELNESRINGKALELIKADVDRRMTELKSMVERMETEQQDHEGEMDMQERELELKKKGLDLEGLKSDLERRERLLKDEQQKHRTELAMKIVEIDAFSEKQAKQEEEHQKKVEEFRIEESEKVAKQLQEEQRLKQIENDLNIRQSVIEAQEKGIEETTQLLQEQQNLINIQKKEIKNREQTLDRMERTLKIQETKAKNKMKSELSKLKLLPSEEEQKAGEILEEVLNEPQEEPPNVISALPESKYKNLKNKNKGVFRVDKDPLSKGVVLQKEDAEVKPSEASRRTSKKG